VALHSALVKAHEEADLGLRSVIYRPVGSTNNVLITGPWWNTAAQLQVVCVCMCVCVCVCVECLLAYMRIWYFVGLLLHQPTVCTRQNIKYFNARKFWRKYYIVQHINTNKLQVMDRVHRVGQKRKVHVVRFVTKHTVEERVAELQRKKTAMITAAIEQLITKQDIDELFRDPILN
jgi:hypothetical protein